jgi:hypothetical protein
VSDRPTLARHDGRRWLPAAAVLAVILAVTGGASVVAAALERPGDARVGFDGVVEVAPAAGWAEDPGLRADGTGLRRVGLAHGGARLVVSAFAGAGVSPHELAVGYAASLEDRFVEVRIGRPQVVVVGEASVGVRFPYVGTTADRVAVEGVVTATVTRDGTGVVLDAVAPAGSLAGVAADVAEMLASVEIG